MRSPPLVSNAGPTLGHRNANSGLGDERRSRDYDGSADHHSISDNATLSITGDLLISFWLWLDSITGVQGIVGKYLTTGNQRSYLVFTSSASVIFAVSGDGSAQTTQTVVTASTSTWYRISLYHDATAQEIGWSVNNAAWSTKAHTTGIFDSTAAFSVGAYNVGGTPVRMNGRIQGVSVSEPSSISAGLLSDYKSTMYNGGSRVLFRHLTSSQKSDWGLTANNGVFFNCDEASEGAALIDSVNGLNGSATGSPGVSAGP